MIAECVGLDIGQTAFKAVRFRRRLTGRESVEYFHLPVPYGRQEQTEPAHRTAMLRNFLWQHGLYGSGEIVTALPARMCLSEPSLSLFAMLPSWRRSSRSKWKI